MSRPDYLDNYRFNWNTFDIMAGGTSSLDANNYFSAFDEREEALNFLKGYGYDIGNTIENAEMFGNFQEALQFIKRYCLKEGNPYGLDVTIPNIFYTITDVSELLLITTRNMPDKVSEEESIWASIILKVMHTILHLDKDIRHQYFTTIQTQIFDRFYRYLGREGDQLYMESEDKKTRIPIFEFDTKSKKSRESTIIKLLHKKENVAEELFDRIGIRFITHTKTDCLRLMNFLHQNYIVSVNNIKPSRSQNTLMDFDVFKTANRKLTKEVLRNNISEADYVKKLEEIAEVSRRDAITDNNHTSKSYSAIHFTCRQLIKYRNPFYRQFLSLKKFARTTDKDSEITKKLQDIDTSSIARDIRFFYPYEVQITDAKSHKMNSDGTASHEEYKKSQLVSAIDRLFRDLILYHQEGTSSNSK